MGVPLSPYRNDQRHRNLFTYCRYKTTDEGLFFFVRPANVTPSKTTNREYNYFTVEIIFICTTYSVRLIDLIVSRLDSVEIISLISWRPHMLMHVKVRPFMLGYSVKGGLYRAGAYHWSMRSSDWKLKTQKQLQCFC